MATLWSDVDVYVHVSLKKQRFKKMQVLNSRINSNYQVITKSPLGWLAYQINDWIINLLDQFKGIFNLSERWQDVRKKMDNT